MYEGGMCGYLACNMLNGERGRCRMYGMGIEFAGVEHVVVFYTCTECGGQ
jgi:hypothetical protein